MNPPHPAAVSTSMLRACVVVLLAAAPAFAHPHVPCDRPKVQRPVKTKVKADLFDVYRRVGLALRAADRDDLWRRYRTINISRALQSAALRTQALDELARIEAEL
jgi:hypothetical protein